MPTRASTLLLFAVQNLEKQLQQVDLELEENAGRVNVMDEHMKNVQQEILYAQHRVGCQLDVPRDQLLTTCAVICPHIGYPDMPLYAPG